jgi:DNA-binding NtrC family response regulator
MSKPVSGISEQAMNLLASYDWPGNVRELQNAIERAVLVCRTRQIDPGDLPFQLSQVASISNGKSLSDMERQHIKKILDETRWNISQAARLLNIDRVTLYNKIKRYQLRQA